MKQLLKAIANGGAYALAFTTVFNFGAAYHNGGYISLRINDFGEMHIEFILLCIWILCVSIYWGMEMFINIKRKVNI